MNEPPRYVAVDVTLPAELTAEDPLVDILGTELFSIGAIGIQTREDPLVLVASFTASDEVDHLSDVRDMVSAVGIEGAKSELRELEPIDWSTHWKQHFVPLQFGDLWIVPTWLEPPDGAERVLRIDPSSAFGTGQHVSTGSCLERIVALRPDQTVLDVGTGTGILALAALKCGAPSAVGVDNDPEAILVANENAALNGYGDRVDFSETPIERIDRKFAFVVANILAGPLIDMAPALARTVDVDGWLALSGILGTQADDVAAAYVAAGLQLERIEPIAEWVRIDLKRCAG